LILEAITFKLALDFFKFLKKNRITATSIKVDFFDKVKHEYIDFADIAAMESWYNKNYIPLDNCSLGDIVSIDYFLATSNTYNFTTEYRAIDVTQKLNLTTGSSYDRQRNAGRQIFINRQIQLIKNAVNDYVKYWAELKYIYVTGIYSPCYAVPGWSENTWYLKSFREAFITSRDTSQFPYNDIKIEEFPPSSADGGYYPSVN
jgi:hypothetical protein|tara:strand:+ start:380 stop:988 length:609 start_codon:yes stop_codon:yes gene_type:complete